MADDDVEKASNLQTTAPDPLARPLSPQHSNWNLMSSYGPQPTFDIGNLNDELKFGEVGTSGLRAFSGWVRDEFLPELQGRQAATKFREMWDNSPIIGAVIYAIMATMRKVEWRVTPAADEDAEPTSQAEQAAEFLQGCMDDMDHTWEDLIVENLTSLVFGFAFHEVVYKRRVGKRPNMFDATGLRLPDSEYQDGLIGWRRIPIRSQDTILKWFFDPYGTITGVTQLPWTGAIVDIPMEKGLLFRPTQYKNNPEGRSILRTAYIPYYYMKRLQEQEAIMGERLGGFPVIRVPMALIEAANSGNAKAANSLNTFRKMAVNLRIDEQMGAVMASDCWQGANGPTTEKMYSIELVTPTGGARGVMNYEASITRYSTNIMTSVLADFLTLGHEARGTQSLAVTKVDMFFQAIEGFLNSVAAIYNLQAVPRLWELNGFDPALMPTIEPDLAQRVDLDVLSNFVLRLSQAGMPMFPNEDLQTFLLDAGGLPDVADPRALQAAGMLDEQLDQKDEQADVALQNMKNPPQPKQQTPLQKMLLASLARRMIRAAGNRYEVRTRKGARHGPRRIRRAYA